MCSTEYMTHFGAACTPLYNSAYKSYSGLMPTNTDATGTGVEVKFELTHFTVASPPSAGSPYLQAWCEAGVH